MGTVSQNSPNEKPSGQHLTPVFGVVIHVIRHGSFRVGSEQPTIEATERGTDITKLINVASDI